VFVSGESVDSDYFVKKTRKRSGGVAEFDTELKTASPANTEPLN
jgi:hypothetical protein